MSAVKLREQRLAAALVRRLQQVEEDRRDDLVAAARRMLRHDHGLDSAEIQRIVDRARRELDVQDAGGTSAN